MSIRQLETPRGTPAQNQIVVSVKQWSIFFSYSVPIAAINGASNWIALDADAWNASRTTARYRNQFLGFNTREARRRIQNNSIQVLNLPELITRLVEAGFPNDISNLEQRPGQVPLDIPDITNSNARTNPLFP